MLGEDLQALFFQPGSLREWDRLLCEDDVSAGDFCSMVCMLLPHSLAGTSVDCRNEVQSLENSLNRLLSPERCSPHSSRAETRALSVCCWASI